MSSISKKQRWILLITSGIGFQGLMFAAFLVSNYYSLIQEATNFSDIELGNLASICGIVALVSYLFSGVLADIFKPKTLIVFSYSLSIVALGFFLTLPSFGIISLLQFVLAFAGVFTYWSACAKFVRSLGPISEEGRNYGIFYAVVGISGVIAGFISSAVTSSYDAATGLRAMLTIWIIMQIIGMLGLVLFYKNIEVEHTAEEDKFQFKYILDILKTPEIWLMGIVGFAGYLTTCVMAYLSPLLINNFGVSLVTMTILATLRSQLARVIAAPISGTLIDRFKSATKVMFMMLCAFLVLMVILLMIPWTAQYVVIAIAILLLLGLLYNSTTTCWFTPLTEIGIPDNMKGTAYGIACFMTFLPDAFFYKLAGNVITDYGDAGYRYLFSGVTVVVVIGILAVMYLRKRIKTKKHQVVAN